MSFAIRVDNLGKQYRLGLTHAGSIRELVNRTWKRLLGRREKLLPHEEVELRALLGGDRVEADGSFWALKDVSFEVQPGEVVGIIGRNGSGKSTLLKILSQITAPTAGRVELHGRVASLLEVGTGFHPELSGRENVFLNGAILGMTKMEIRRKFDEIVAFAEIEKFIDTPVKRYSSGMYVRLAFAVAAHLEPEILVVDEVLAVGDAEFQKKCLGKMGEVSKHGRTILFVSHNMGAVNVLCERVIHLANGQLRDIGRTVPVVTAYLAETTQPDPTDLNQLRLSGMGTKVRFTAVKLISGKEGALRFGSAIVFDLDLESSIQVDDLSIASTIFTVSGTCVGTLFSREKLSLAPGERAHFTLTIRDAGLAPGRYYAGFSIGQGGLQEMRRDLDIIIGCPVLQVLPANSAHVPLSEWSANWGSIAFTNTKLERLSR